MSHDPHLTRHNQWLTAAVRCGDLHVAEYRAIAFVTLEGQRNRLVCSTYKFVLGIALEFLTHLVNTVC